jgi:hypothetical protein
MSCLPRTVSVISRLSMDRNHPTPDRPAGSRNPVRDVVRSRPEGHVVKAADGADQITGGYDIFIE